MLKVIKLNSGKFGIKEINDNGDSVGMKEEVFNTESEALLFLKGENVEAPKDENKENTTMEDEEKKPVDGEETSDTDEEKGEDEIDSEESAA